MKCGTFSSAFFTAQMLSVHTNTLTTGLTQACMPSFLPLPTTAAFLTSGPVPDCVSHAQVWVTVHLLDLKPRQKGTYVSAQTRLCVQVGTWEHPCQYVAVGKCVQMVDICMNSFLTCSSEA